MVDLVAVVTACLSANGSSCGACGPGCEYCAAPFDDAPRFHLMDQRGCAENDPNGPVFDPVHGVMHLFFQDHLSQPGGSGPVYGHFVSKDWVHWAQLPVAIWNGPTAYDTRAIYTGSAAVIQGAGPNGSRGIVQIYPGLCDDALWPNCQTGTGLAQALPADYSDELLSVWSKPSYNPIMNNTERDPSSPWRTRSGEWRLRTYNSKIYAASSDADLVAGHWYEVGVLEALRTCECPSLYPLPALTPGFVNTTRLPTHVHKTSCAGADWWQLGDYVAGSPGQVGSFNATPGWEDLFVQVKIDPGAFYASKDNVFPALDNSTRRVNWGWAKVDPASAQTLPREITFNPEARVLEQKPLEELTQLRVANGSQKLNDTIVDGTLDLNFTNAKHSEVIASFQRPDVPAVWGLNVSGCAACHFDMSASDAVNVSCADLTTTLRLLPSETTLDLRVFTDATFLEAYFQSGRVAMTVKCDSVVAGNIAVFALGDPLRLASLAAFPLKSIWVDSDVVREAPRLYFEQP